MISEALSVLFPDAVNTVDYILVDLGNGTKIEKWALKEPIPTQKELDAAYATYLSQEYQDTKTNTDIQKAIGGSAFNAMLFGVLTDIIMGDLNKDNVDQLIPRATQYFKDAGGS
jgi:hypothetical protein